MRNVLKPSPKSSEFMVISRSSAPFSMNRVLWSLMMTIMMSALCFGESKLESISTERSDFDSSNKGPLAGHLVTLGKRSTANQELEGLPEPSQRETVFVQPILPDLEQFSEDPDLEQFVDEEKRSPSRYSFGIGKRIDPLDYDLDSAKRYDWNRYSSIKRLPASRYNFGIGKKSRYNFGIGKKSRYNFGIGKRVPSQRYSFGIGK